MPCILDIALSGLRALRVLIVRKAWIPPAPRREAVKFIRDTWVSGLVGKWVSGLVGWTRSEA